SSNLFRGQRDVPAPAESASADWNTKSSESTARNSSTPRFANAHSTTRTAASGVVGCGAVTTGATGFPARSQAQTSNRPRALGQRNAPAIKGLPPRALSPFAVFAETPSPPRAGVPPLVRRTLSQRRTRLPAVPDADRRVARGGTCG